MNEREDRAVQRRLSEEVYGDDFEEDGGGAEEPVEEEDQTVQRDLDGESLSDDTPEAQTQKRIQEELYGDQDEGDGDEQVNEQGEALLKSRSVKKSIADIAKRNGASEEFPEGTESPKFSTDTSPARIAVSDADGQFDVMGFQKDMRTEMDVDLDVVEQRTGGFVRFEVASVGVNEQSTTMSGDVGQFAREVVMHLQNEFGFDEETAKTIATSSVGKEEIRKGFQMGSNVDFVSREAAKAAQADGVVENVDVG